MKVTELIIRIQMKGGNKTSRISTSGIDKVYTPLHSHQKQACGLHGLFASHSYTHEHYLCWHDARL